MVGEHFETGKFTTMAQERSHECHWTRPQPEDQQGGRQSILCPFAACQARRKVFGYLPSPHSLKEPKSLYH
jgi:hypothetical protein